MNELQKIERLRLFFWSMRRRWPWMLLALAITGGGSYLLDNMEEPKTAWHTVVLCVVLAAACFVLFWVSSFFIVNALKKKIAAMYANGVPAAAKPKDKVQISFARLLSPRARLRAFINFKELRDISDYCFLGGPSSYVRIQWLKPELRAAHEPKELVRAWPENNQLCIGFSFEGEEIQLSVVRVCSENGERVYACLTPRNPTREERESAEKIQLLMDEPCVLAYGTVYEQPDGTKVPCDELLCAITWMGGNH